jgi:CheY-like chemotaxis protein
MTATDGEEALNLLQLSRPAAILLDMLLPKVSGPNVLRALKQDPGTTGIPVIVVTRLSKNNEQKLPTGGATAFIGKAELLN